MRFQDSRQNGWVQDEGDICGRSKNGSYANTCWWTEGVDLKLAQHLVGDGARKTMGGGYVLGEGITFTLEGEQ